MKHLEETHGTTFELVRHFLAGIFDSEMFAAGGQWRSVAVGIFSTLLPGGLFVLDKTYAARYRYFSRLAWPEPFREALVADEIGLLALLFSISGLAAMIQWQMLLPSHRDYFALASLPIRPRQVFAARFISFLIAAAVFILALNVLPSFMAPSVFTGRWLENPAYWTNLAAWFTATSLTCLFALFGSVTLQGLMLNLLPARWYVGISSWVQGLLGALFFLIAIVSFRSSDWPHRVVQNLTVLQWAPPVWFAGLLRSMTGTHDTFLLQMAERAVVGSIACAALAVSVYFVSYRRYRILLLEVPGAPSRSPRSFWSVAGLMAHEPRRRGVFEFMGQTLTRNRTHRLVALAYMGFAIGVLINSALAAAAVAQWNRRFSETLAFVILYWPIAATMIILPGMRHLFSMPVELRANWLFRVSESEGRTHWMSAVERFTLVFGIAPVYMVLGPIAIHVLGWAIALRMTSLQILISLTIFELLFHSWQQLPFTCSYAPGQKSIMSFVGKHFGALVFLAPALAILIAPIAQLNPLFAPACCLLGALWLRMRSLRREGWGEAHLIYEDSPEAMTDLGLRG